MSHFCTNCGSHTDDNDRYCQTCGAAQFANPCQASAAQEYSYPVENMSKTRSTASLILGIASIVLCSTIIISLGCGIAAVVLAAINSKKGQSDGCSKAGLITGIVGIVISFLMIAIFLIFSSLFSELLLELPNFNFDIPSITA